MGSSAVRSVPDAALAALARGQLGLLSRRQAAEADLTPVMIRRRVQSGRWVPVAPDVFLLHGTPFTWPTRVMAACLATGGIASHRTAAALHGLDEFPPGPIELSVGRTSRRAQVDLPGATVHRSTDIGYAGMGRLAGGIPTTGPARLVADLGACVSAGRYERAVDELIERGLLTWDEVLASLLTHARRGRDGVGPLRQLVEARRGTDVGDTVIERAFLRLLRSRGLPEPVARYEIAGTGGSVVRVAFAFPEHRVAIELDGGPGPLDRHAPGSDHRERASLLASGWVVLAFTWRMVLDSPGAAVKAVRAVLDTPPVRDCQSACDERSPSRGGGCDEALAVR